MQGEGRPPDVDVECLLQFFNTPGDEVAPGSNVIGKYFQYEWFRQGRILLYEIKWGGSWGMNHPE